MDRSEIAPFNAVKAAAEQLGSAMAAKTDNVLREAITRFLGRDDWALADLKGRGALIRLQSGVEVFSLDGVALVEFCPIEIDDEQNGFSHVLRATRQHRFLISDRAAKNHLEA